MGCVPQRQRRSQSVNSFGEQLRKIRLVSQQQQLKTEKELAQQEKLLAQTFAMDPRQRSQLTQKAVIGRTVYTRHLIMIWKIIENEARKVEERKQMLRDQTYMKELLPSIDTLTFSSTFLNDQSLRRFSNHFHFVYPDYKIPPKERIKDKLIAHHSTTDQVDLPMQNTYLLEFCSRSNVDIATINKAGHQYGYSAGIYDYGE